LFAAILKRRTGSTSPKIAPGDDLISSVPQPAYVSGSTEKADDEDPMNTAIAALPRLSS
jgi:hypothetical protein